MKLIKNFSTRHPQRGTSLGDIPRDAHTAFGPGMAILLAVLAIVSCSEFTRKNEIINQRTIGSDFSDSRHDKMQIQNAGSLGFMLAGLSKPADLVTVELSSKNSDRTYTKEFPYEPNNEMLVDKIDEGPYALRINVYDGSKLQYQGGADVEIVADVVTRAEVTLGEPDPSGFGTLVITIIEEGGPTPTPPPQDTITVRPDSLPLVMEDISIGTRRSLTLDLPLANYKSAAFSLAADDIDDSTEAKMYINGTEVPLPPAIIDTDGQVTVGPVVLDMGLLKSGDNQVEFELAARPGGTRGYIVKDFFVTLSCDGPTPSPTTSPASSPDPTNGFYVSADGKSSASGSIDDPWDLAAALAHPDVVQPGDTLWFRGGTYVRTGGWLQSYLQGTAGKPIVLRPFPNEHVVIDLYNPADPDSWANMQALGDYTHWYDFEVMSSKPHSRKTNETSLVNPEAPQIRRGSVCNHAVGTKFVNMIVHDLRIGFTNQHEGIGGESYGNIIYNNGFISKNGSGQDDMGRAHGMYLQNTGVAVKRFSDNVAFNNFNYGIHAYAEKAGRIQKLKFHGNLSFNNGDLSARRDFLVGGGTPANDIEFIDNLSYHQGFTGEVQMGRGNNDTGLIFMDNYLASGELNFSSNWSNVTSSGNTAVDSTSGHVPSGITVNKNPTVNKVFVRPNKYESGRANIIVYNWAGNASVEVDLSTVLSVGTGYRIHHVYDLSGTPTVSGVYEGGNVTIPMKATAAPKALGGDTPDPVVQGPEFGVFIVRTK